MAAIVANAEVSRACWHAACGFSRQHLLHVSVAVFLNDGISGVPPNLQFPAPSTPQSPCCKIIVSSPRSFTMPASNPARFYPLAVLSPCLSPLWRTLPSCRHPSQRPPQVGVNSYQTYSFIREFTGRPVGTLEATVACATKAVLDVEAGLVVVVSKDPAYVRWVCKYRPRVRCHCCGCYAWHSNRPCTHVS